MQNATNKMIKSSVEISARLSTRKSKRMTKTLVELSIGIIGLLAIMISQLGAQNSAPVLLENLSGVAPVKLVFMLCEELPKTVTTTSQQLNR